MSQPCSFCALISSLPQNGDMLQTHILTDRSKYQSLNVNMMPMMVYHKSKTHPEPFALSDEAEKAISVIIRERFPPTKREDRYAMSCPHAPAGNYVKYMFAVIGEKTTHLIGNNEFLMRMWLEKPSPPSVDGANATGTQ